MTVECNRLMLNVFDKFCFLSTASITCSCVYIVIACFNVLPVFRISLCAVCCRLANEDSTCGAPPSDAQIAYS